MCLFCFSFADDWRPRVSQAQRLRHPEPAVPSTSSVLPEFTDVVSPWNTRESMRTSDDVAQLLVSDRIVVVSMHGQIVESVCKKGVSDFVLVSFLLSWTRHYFYSASLRPSA